MKIGQVWRHRNGMVVKIIGRHCPGDRDDEPRFYCEVLRRGNPLTPKQIAENYVDYQVGQRDGWYLSEGNGWEVIGAQK
jgi:hypothetical protein